MRALRTARLTLRPVRRENARELWRILQQPDLRTYQDLPDVDIAQFERMVASRPRMLEPGTWGRFEWLVMLDGVVSPVGWVSVRIGERASGTAEVGYSVLREFRGQGIATEALDAVVAESFVHADVRRVRAYCVPENFASRAVLSRAGFAPDGMLPHGATVHGRAVDVLGFMLERTAWQEQQRAKKTSVR